MIKKQFERIQDECFTFGEAARAIGITPVTLWRWMKLGKIEGYRLGREVFVERAAVEKLRRSG